MCRESKLKSKKAIIGLKLMTSKCMPNLCALGKETFMECDSAACDRQPKDLPRVQTRRTLLPFLETAGNNHRVTRLGKDLQDH